LQQLSYQEVWSVSFAMYLAIFCWTIAPIRAPARHTIQSRNNNANKFVEMELLSTSNAMMEILKTEMDAPAVVKSSLNIDVQQTTAYLLPSASLNP
jgi:hypothetical protein